MKFCSKSMIVSICFGGLVVLAGCSDEPDSSADAAVSDDGDTGPHDVDVGARDTGVLDAVGGGADGGAVDADGIDGGTVADGSSVDGGGADAGFDGELDIDTTPCEVGPDSWSAGDVVAIDCQIDLDEATVAVPADVSLEYAGGEIIDGTLSFESNATIDGRLLNYQLDIEGDVRLQDPHFYFYPGRWNLVEGPAPDADALLNRDRFTALIDLVKRLEGDTFEMGEFDAYFKVDDPYDEAHPEDSALRLPSDFSLVMSQQTHLRTQPSARENTVLLAITDEHSNVRVTGGHLHGERDEHDYSSGDSHEWGHVLVLRGCSEVTIDGVEIADAAGDGIDIQALGRADRSNYRPTHDSVIRNNTIIRARRNGMSITAAHDLLVEGNEFIDTGIDTESSEGTNPRFAIDIEAFRGGTSTEKVEDITVRDNTEHGSARGGFLVSAGVRITMEDNQVESGLALSRTVDSIIRNNELVSDDGGGTALVAGKATQFDNTHGNRVYGNSVSGYNQGIIVANNDLEVYDNTVTDCKTGMVLDDTRDARIYDNTIESSRDGSDGITSRYGGTEDRRWYLDEVDVTGNTVDVTRTPLKIFDMNRRDGQEDFEVSFEQNEFISGYGSSLEDTHGLDFEGNTLTGGRLKLKGLESSEVVDNNITSSGSYGIRIDEGCRDLSIADNQVSVAAPHQCILHQADDAVNITETGNSCEQTQ